jgi:hypothetical protein
LVMLSGNLAKCPFYFVAYSTSDHETDSFILQLLQDLDPSARYLLSENTNELLYPCNSKIKGTCEICLERCIEMTIPRLIWWSTIKTASSCLTAWSNWFIIY